jgi:hypothetical protein
MRRIKKMALAAAALLTVAAFILGCGQKDVSGDDGGNGKYKNEITR